VRGEHDSRNLSTIACCGAPPRARGTRGSRRRPRCPMTEHPRVRGEHADLRDEPRAHLGAPPRARGTPGHGDRDGAQGRSTPACAGNTGSGDGPSRETERSTPACAGNTRAGTPACGCRSEHPRVRGEHGAPVSDITRVDGAPPRARGTQHSPHDFGAAHRSTPACAGNTRGARRGGERTLGAPPRARGTLGAPLDAVGSLRSTPACAGNTAAPHPAFFWTSEHPRVRGEHKPDLLVHAGDIGAPPRARGTQVDGD